MFISKNYKKIILKKKPKPHINWYGEPNLGSSYNSNEINELKKTLIRSSNFFIGLRSDSDENIVFEKKFKEMCNSKFALTVSNNGIAFYMILKSLNLKKNDEIIIPSLNFKAWHMALLDLGVKIVECDVDLNTYNLSLLDLENKITKKTIAICPVHLTGLSCDIDGIEKIAGKFKNYRKSKIKVIYDSARATGFNYKNKNLGDKGYANIFSFQSGKLITSGGEGGMVTTNNKKLYEKLKSLRNYGNEYDWGLNLKLSKIQAKFGEIQLKRVKKNIQLRRKIALRRNDIFKEFSTKVFLPNDTIYSKNSYYLYPILLNENFKRSHRDEIVRNLADKYKIYCSTLKFVNKRWPYIKKKISVPNLPNTNFIADNCFCPIIHQELNKNQEMFLCSVIYDELKKL
jgi:perosamine synthetase